MEFIFTELMFGVQLRMVMAIMLFVVLKYVFKVNFNMLKTFPELAGAMLLAVLFTDFSMYGAESELRNIGFLLIDLIALVVKIIMPKIKANKVALEMAKDKELKERSINSKNARELTEMLKSL